MPASVPSPADVVNLALRRMGYKLRVGSLFEGSEAAKKALDLYAQTRDEVLRQNDWGFAERNVNLSVIKTAPAGGLYVPPTVWNPIDYPPLPWLYEYSWPSDCLKVRAVKPCPVFVPVADPQPFVFATPNDNTLDPVQRVIVCNVLDAVCVYTGQVTNPANWEPDFVEAFAAALGRRLAPGLVGMEAAKLIFADEGNAMAVAEREQG
jgi:hypothetical protein